MVKHGCVDGELDDTKYGAPVPLIGIYIAAATMVCLVFMVYDLLASFRTRKRWLPCKLFSLNSIVLTLLSVAAKLPIDLTSPMPSAQDQLSKLTSTAMICISMGFFMPSIGNNKESECLSNMIALSIFVVTLVVNICMQMYTGVIFLFTVEHIIILCCMLGLLVMLWFLAHAINTQKTDFINLQKDLIQKGKESMLERLKMCYLYGFNSNPQFVPCKDPHCATIGFLCILSLVVVIQAAIRSIIVNELKVCRGNSDYGLSMWMIVVTQILIVIIGGSATSFRWLAMVSQMHGDRYKKSKKTKPTYINPILGIEAGDIWNNLWEKLLQMGDFLMIVVIFIPATTVNHFVLITFYQCCIRKYRECRVIEEFKDLVYGDMGLDEWTLWKSVTEMNKWMDVSKAESLNHLPKLLSRTQPTRQLHTLELKDQPYLDDGIEVSILSMVLLVRIAAVSIPPTLSGFLVQTLNEAYEIICFINDRINFTSIKNKEKSKFAKLVWKGRDFHVLLPIIYGRSSTRTVEPQSGIDHAILIIRELKNALPSDVVWNEVGVITDFINRRSYSSIRDLYDYIEQLLVDMLHLFFAQLPIVIYNDIAESPPEDYEKRVRVSLKLIWKIKPLETLVQWSLPVGCNVLWLITPEVPTTEIQNNTLEECNTTATTPDDDVIIRVT